MSLPSLPSPFRFRLNCIDHYQATPTALDPQFGWDFRPSQGKNAPTVPVIRVFGATETGQKVCAHIHGALPYLYLLYEGGLGDDEGKTTTILLYCGTY
jgi:DNA polymerase zeta